MSHRDGDSRCFGISQQGFTKFIDGLGSFVWMQGHNYSNFSNPQVQPMLLRGIAWAARRSADTLMQERPGRGGQGTTDAAPAGRGRGN